MINLKKLITEVDDETIIKYKDKDGNSKEMVAQAAKRLPDDHPAKEAWQDEQSSDKGDDSKPEAGKVSFDRKDDTNDDSIEGPDGDSFGDDTDDMAADMNGNEDSAVEYESDIEDSLIDSLGGDGDVSVEFDIFDNNGNPRYQVEIDGKGKEITVDQKTGEVYDYDENYKQGWDPKGTAYGNVNESKVASTKLTKILKENTYLGELPSSKLIKMKWNPVTDIKLKQIYEGKKFKPGDMWSDDFDYKGMMVYGSKVKINVGVKTLRKLYDSAEDVNYHTENSLLWPVIQHLEKGDKKNAEALLKLYNKLAKKTASTIKEGKLNEAYKSDIVKKWDSTKVMMNDLRQFILQASEAGGADLARDVADALKLMSNYAMGEYKKANRK